MWKIKNNDTANQMKHRPSQGHPTSKPQAHKVQLEKSRRIQHTAESTSQLQFTLKNKD